MHSEKSDSYVPLFKSDLRVIQEEGVHNKLVETQHNKLAFPWEYLFLPLMLFPPFLIFGALFIICKAAEGYDY
jgi:hypothetical protein